MTTLPETLSVRALFREAATPLPSLVMRLPWETGLHLSETGTDRRLLADLSQATPTPSPTPVLGLVLTGSSSCPRWGLPAILLTQTSSPHWFWGSQGPPFGLWKWVSQSLTQTLAFTSMATLGTR